MKPGQMVRSTGKTAGQAGRQGTSAPVPRATVRPGRSWPEQQRRVTDAGLNRSFHNPYSFVPFIDRPPRRDVAEAANRASSDEERTVLQEALDLLDGDPPGHHVWKADRYHGWLDVELTLVTPMLLPDTDRAREGRAGHKVLPVLVRNGRPWLPPSSVKGVIRTAFECVTNSRVPHFERHSGRLGFRMAPQEGLRLIPARVVDNGTTVEVHPLTGTSEIGKGEKPGGSLYAAWLPRYIPGQAGVAESRALTYENGDLPQHGEAVTCWIEEFRLVHCGYRPQDDKEAFRYWRVRRVARQGERLGDKPQPTLDPGRRDGRSCHRPAGEPMMQVHGWVVVTNQNIGNKHDERVFFCQGTPTVLQYRGDEAQRLRELWRDVVQGYLDAHSAEDVHKRPGAQGKPERFLGPEPGNTAWSRHLYDQDALTLAGGPTGTLCYVRRDGRSRITGLFPVNISRDLYESPPAECVPTYAKAAAKHSEFSPADRVFGWVPQQSEVSYRAGRAYRGHVRIGPVTCLSDYAVEDFRPRDPDGLPLAILAAPKPQQARFYLGRADGSAQDDELERRQAGYNVGKQLRGRKVYPYHQGLPAGLWADPLTDDTERGYAGWYREYRCPPGNGTEQRDRRNRSIEGWVKLGTRFTVRIWFDNLARVELGALVYVLNGHCRGHHLRLGGGKPFGFGSAQAKIVAHEILDGHQLAARYRQVLRTATEQQSHSEPVDFEEAFLAASRAVYGVNPAHLASWERSALGFDDRKPIRYPRSTVTPDPEGHQFQWFVRNERGGRLALGDLIDDPGLAHAPELCAPRDGRSHRGSREPQHTRRGSQ